jgi:uroporphyrinogen-III synthase
MRLLVTRPREDAETIAGLLRARGHHAVIAPLLEIRLHSGDPLPLEGVQAILATSANGVRALAARTARREIPLYAVGPQTAETARQSGFSSVRSAEGDAAALVEIVAAQLDPHQGVLFHAAGAETAGRLRQALAARGFQVETSVLYEAAQIERLPDNVAAELGAGALDGVLLFSPRSARIFASLVEAAGLSEACAKLGAYCISAATAAALGGANFSRVSVAGAPNQEAMLSLLPAGKPFLGRDRNAL